MHEFTSVLNESSLGEAYVCIDDVWNFVASAWTEKAHTSGKHRMNKSYILYVIFGIFKRVITMVGK